MHNRSSINILWHMFFILIQRFISVYKNIQYIKRLSGILRDYISLEAWCLTIHSLTVRFVFCQYFMSLNQPTKMEVDELSTWLSIECAGDNFVVKWSCFLSSSSFCPQISRPTVLMTKVTMTIGNVELSFYRKLTFLTCSFHFACKREGSTALSFGCREEAHWRTGITHSFPSFRFQFQLILRYVGSLVSIPAIMRWRWGYI